MGGTLPTEESHLQWGVRADLSYKLSQRLYKESVRKNLEFGSTLPSLLSSGWESIKINHTMKQHRDLVIPRRSSNYQQFPIEYNVKAIWRFGRIQHVPSGPLKRTALSYLLPAFLFKQVYKFRSLLLSRTWEKAGHSMKKCWVQFTRISGHQGKNRWIGWPVSRHLTSIHRTYFSLWCG